MPHLCGINTILDMMYVLASGSPRRRRLLEEVVPFFDVDPSDVDETVDASLSPEKKAETLAERKCAAVFARHGDDLVIGCDTVVEYGGEIMGKPRDARDAARMLRALSGNTHRVVTGVCLKCGDRTLVGHDVTEVRFNVLSDEFVENYVGGGSPMDKAGAYGIQDEGVVAGYSGSYSNVVGLPVELLRDMLEEIQR